MGEVNNGGWDGVSSNDSDEIALQVRKRRGVGDGHHQNSWSSTSAGGLDDDDDDNDDDLTMCSARHPLLPAADRRHRVATGDLDANIMTDGGHVQTSKYTAEDAIEALGIGCFQFKMCCICGLYMMTDALEMMLLSVLSPEVRCEWRLDDWSVAFISVIVFVGMLFGSNIWGSLADRYGRRPIVIIAACWIAYFGVLTSFSPNYVWIVVLRGLVGTGFGGAVQSFTLLSEYLPSKYRAKILISNNVMWALGTSFEVLMAYAIIPRAGWRLLVFMSALPMVISVLCTFAFPESLRYLLAAGQHDKAVEVLQGIAKSNHASLPPGELIQSVPLPRGRFRDLLHPNHRCTVLLLWLLWFGVASIYYGIVLAQSEILERGGVCTGEIKHSASDRCHCNLLSSDDYISMIIATFGEFVAIPLNLLTIDSLGRKWTLGIDYLGAAVCCLLCQICNGQKLLLTIFMFGIRSFISGAFNVVYIYTVEVLPTTIRSIGLGSCSGAARLGCLVTPFIAQVLLAYSVRFSLGFYAGLATACALATYFLSIETRGRALQQAHPVD